MNLGAKINCYILNSILLLTVSVLQWMYRFWGNFFQKIEINCLSGNKAFRVIQNLIAISIFLILI